MVNGQDYVLPMQGAPGSIPAQGARSHVPRLSAHTLQLKIPCATTKTLCSQINPNKCISKKDSTLQSDLHDLNRRNLYLLKGVWVEQWCVRGRYFYVSLNHSMHGGRAWSADGQGYLKQRASDKRQGKACRHINYK